MQKKLQRVPFRLRHKASRKSCRIGKEKKEEIETELEQVEEWWKRDTINGKVSSSWARLIKKIFEIDPLQCPVCKTEMRIIAFITDYQEVRKIFKYIGKETIRPPPLLYDEAPEVTYEPATYFASTMVEFQTRI